MNDEILEELKGINVKMSALLTITVDRHIRDTDIARPRPRSIDKMLSDIGLANVEIAKLLGKSPQAVGQSLARDGKSANKDTSAAEKKVDEVKKESK